jgi:hypothetical protein
MAAAISDRGHHQILPVEKPRIDLAYDTDPKQSDSRVRVLDMLAAQNPANRLSFPLAWIRPCLHDNPIRTR